MIVYRGKIKAIDAPNESGCMTLTIGGREVVADNAPTVRSLDAAFGNVIGPGHTFNLKNVLGKDIVYVMDDMNLTMGGFTPYDQWLEDGKPAIPEDGQIELNPEND